MAEFVVGDAIQFEWGNGLSCPRWNIGKDQGSTGKFGQGKVVSAGTTEFRIEYIFNNTPQLYNFTYKDQANSGFPTLFKPSKEQTEGAESLKRWLSYDAN